MAWTKNIKITQDIKVRVKMDGFIDKLIELIEEDINTRDGLYDAELEVDDVEDLDYALGGSYECHGDSWYSPQTMWEPAEYEEDRPTYDNVFLKMIHKHADELVKLIDFVVEENTDEATWHFPEPDYD